MRKITYRTIIEKDGKYYHGYVPALTGCHTQGKTVEETRKNLREAIMGWLLASQDLNWPIPEDDLIEVLETVTLPQTTGRVYA